MIKSINKIIKILIFYDLVFMLGWGLITPILAIFINNNIKGGNVQVVGIAAGIYWILKSIFQLPVGRFLDKNYREKDDYYFLVAGTLLTSLIPIGFIFATLPWHIYFLQIMHAFAMALVLPAWGAIFTRHLDKGKEAQSWALDSSFLGVATGVSGILGGIIAKFFGFNFLFIGVSIFSLISAFLCFLIRDDILFERKRVVILKKNEK